ncbi:Oxysterol-binding protein 3 [Sporothrix eucalyptigena]|uniref:Oxysterol-binding protein 3 n=1 Tax=Sporothrix eucalyptigena TaxID=1812306 RepID=A0ABP0CXM1_9PEZI
MAGIEQLEIHSKSYIVRWVKVDEGHTISWSVQPHKKSINFGIVKHPGTGGTNLTTFQSELDDGQSDAASDAKPGLFNKKDAGTAPEQLRKKGFKLVNWHGKCDADKVSMGTYDVQAGNGGMFGLVFDNTFSRQTSKNATFVLLTYPIGAPPQGARNLPNLQAGPAASTSRSSLGKNNSPRLGALPTPSIDSLNSHLAINGTPGGVSGVTTAAVTSGGAAGAETAGGSRSISGSGGSSANLRSGTPSGSSGTASSSNHHVGTLMKRRRKKGQGYARRFFSLDYATCTFSYYHNRNSSALRGAIPLSLAAIAADERRREITIDSGAEVWHLKASNDKEFTEWARALERSSRIARGLETVKGLPADSSLSTQNLLGIRSGELPAPVAPKIMYQEETREWQQVEALVSRVVGTRDALRRLVKDMAAANHQQAHAAQKSHFLSPNTPPVSEEPDDYLSSQQSTPTGVERRPFWRRRSSASPLAPQNFRSSVASTLAMPAPSTASSLSTNLGTAGSKHGAKHEGRSMEDHCQALLGDLDSVVSEFTKLLSNSKHRRTTSAVAANIAAPRNSYDSTSTTDEFFDAAEGSISADRSQLLRIDNHSEAEDTPGSEMDEEAPSAHGDGDESSVSSVDDEEEYTGLGEGNGAGSDGNNLFPPKPKSLAPLPIADAVQRRKTIPPSTVLPPSLIAFVRKNVGKDLSTISMPVSANEPTSLLQRVAEQVEYAQLLNEAAAKSRPEERLLYVTAFAVSQFSGGRAKERAIRKPFNPLLGETFELLRTEKEMPGGGMRVLVEKVSHRPVRIAIQADAPSWSFAQAAAPSQKFWGKSAEIITEGRVRVVLRLLGGAEEHYSWALATVFLRNVVMGEKYVEPVGTMNVVNDTTGAHAAVEFRSKGMFGGRSEDVQIETYDAAGSHTGLALTGTWTNGLKLVDPRNKAGGLEIWRVGPLVDDSARVYGLTQFAASLNEVTPLEKGKLAPTDCRLRPDQRLAEDGKLDEAEEWKTKLEEAQRTRRRQLEERGVVHKPRWFVKVATGPDGDEVWRLKGGKDGYWEERAKGTWTGVEDIFSGEVDEEA